ncbi:MAG: DUF192 domain-containing protein [Verrucomicrobia bacterium]|nr:DUF192 domain-containing protein [Verrucomicrobiota bacterium]
MTWNIRNIIALFLVIIHSAYGAELTYLTTKISAPKGEILAEIADTQIKRSRGLSYRQNLPQGQSMLFVYQVPGYHPIWMKGMNFAIDVLWLNADKIITYMVPNFSPKAYYKNGSISHHSPQPDTLYVVELPAGDASRLGITVGTELFFQLPASK